ncbi:MAG TPA: Rieske 2Fe-2S domain-containing protein [Anaerolineales bacterium]|nr:Rieske 2Fe-2S domain-containing protein [Anaerolineales bacterium]
MTAKQNEAESEKQPVNRREFLNLAWLASLGILTVNLGGVTYLFAMPRFKEGEFGGIFTVGKVSELPSAGSPPVNYPKVKLWLSNTEQGVVGLYKVCTHLGCLYNWDEQGNRFLCPCHGSQFEANGTYITGPAPRSLDRFVIRVVDPDSGEVLAEAAAGEPMQLPDNPNAVIQVDTGQRITGERPA